MYTEQIDAQCSKIDQTYDIHWHWTKLMLNVQKKMDQTYNINWHWTKLMRNVQFKI